MFDVLYKSKKTYQLCKTIKQDPIFSNRIKAFFELLLSLPKLDSLVKESENEYQELLLHENVFKFEWGGG